MSNPVFDLQGILTEKAASLAVVISIDGGVAHVAIRNGVVDVAFAEGIRVVQALAYGFQMLRRALPHHGIVSSKNRPTTGHYPSLGKFTLRIVLNSGMLRAHRLKEILRWTNHGPVNNQ
ncbi:MAG: hypothetical protein HQL74_10620 [Magnetococcales bacterium]|nr:hypothetical protein [Magnetococcales bacterium]